MPVMWRVIIGVSVILGYPVLLVLLFIVVTNRRRREAQEHENRKRQEAQEREQARIAREGLRGRIFKDREVPVTVWRTEWNHPNRLGGSVLGGTSGSVVWLDGEKRELLADDIVLEWDFLPHPQAWRHGYAIERKGRIVAEVLTFMS